MSLNQPYYVLEVRYADGSSESHEIADERRIIGRSKVKADVQINDKKASGRHVEVSFVAGTVTVRDLGSTNGTMHNGQKSEKFALGPGGSFRIGDTTIRLMAIHGAEEEASRTVVSAPAWIEEDEATRALSAEQIAEVTGHAPAEPAPPAKRPVRKTVAYHPALGGQPEPPRPDTAREKPAAPPPAEPERPTRQDAPVEPEPEPMAYPEEEEAYDDSPPDWAQEAAQPAAAPLDLQKQVVVQQQPGWEQPQGSSGLPAGPIQLGIEVTGGEVFKKLFLGYLLCLVTLFIYTPWYIVSLTNWWYEKLRIQGNRGDFELSFEGTGGKLFVKVFVGYLLTLITLTIYAPWFFVSITKWFTENTHITDPDGNSYELEFTLTGGALFKFLFVNGLLTLITGGIWMAWYFCRWNALLMSNVFISHNGRRIGTLEFTGSGGKFFLLVFVNYLLTILTVFIYFAWFQVKIMKFVAENTWVHVNQTSWQGQFDGRGVDLLKIFLWALLIPLTAGFYMFWWLPKKWRFEIGGRSFVQS